MKLKRISTALQRITKKGLVGVLVTAFLGGGTLAYFGYDSRAILLESEESKTTKDGPVFNRIRWFPGKREDVWMMQQSHHGLAAVEEEWDRLAIIIDKTRSPKTARFIQLEPGPLEWKEGLKPKAFRVSCFMCHSNGPRAIRPNAASDQIRLSMGERLKVLAWNLRIKTYGRVVPAEIHEVEDRTAVVPFRFRGNLENQRLQVKTCLHCHRESGVFARGALTRQNALTIQFMVSKGHMPPLGFSLSKEELGEVEDFIAGF